MELIPAFTPERVVIVDAHADDADYFAGGTIARWAATGAEIYLIVLTNGSKGSIMLPKPDLVQRRQEEQRLAAEIMGIKDVFFGGFEDGQLTNSEEVRRFIVRHIRAIMPDTVIGWDPGLIYSTRHNYVNHRDHREAGLATQDSVWVDARNAATFRDLLEDEFLLPHKVRRLVYFTLADTVNHIVDITDYVGVKRQAMTSHGSQNESIARFAGYERWFGQIIGVEHAEGFIVIELHD
jgi:LmbE family N-acetylglucosaminyl deacetylase